MRLADPVTGAADRLALGSSLLLAGFVAFRSSGTIVSPFGVALSWIAVAAQLAGWLSLLEAASPGSGKQAHPLVPRMLRGSVIVFVIGMLALPSAFPDGGGQLAPLFWIAVVGLGLFPYVPCVFAPLAALYGAIFFTMGRSFGRPSARISTAVGYTWLLCLAAGALAIQFLAPSLLIPWMSATPWGLAGLTSLGYALIAVGRRLESAITGPRAAPV